MKATIVTALYDIGRDNIDGRKMEQYLEWFSKTLLFECPMVVYCEEMLNDFITKMRPSHLPTKVINQKLEEIPYYYLKPRMDEVLENKEYKLKIKDSERIECKVSLYSIIQYSKFQWVLKTAKSNPFNSEYFFWLDAGASRLIPDVDVRGKRFPGENFLSQILQSPEKTLFQVYVASYPDLALSQLSLSHDYLYDNRSFVMGGMFGADRKGIEKSAKLVDEILVNEMLAKGCLNNEQIALGYLLKRDSSDFILFVNDYKIHRNFELIYQSFT